MERSSFKLRKVLKKYSHKRGNIFGGIFGVVLKAISRDSDQFQKELTYDIFSILRVAKANPYGLINKENICIRIPRVRVRNRDVFVIETARP